MKSSSFALAVALSVLAFSSAWAKENGRVTQIVRDVQVLPGRSNARPAALNETVREGSALRTGADSRAELTFPDLTITRLGANSIFSFDRGGRTLDVQDGAVLLRVPKASGGARVNSGTVTVAVTGTTLLFETHPGGISKLIILEGSAKAFLTKHPSQVVTLGSGQMIVVRDGATVFGSILNVNLKKVMKGYLITKFGPLPSLALIQAAIAQQQSSQGAGQLFDPNSNPTGDLTGMDARDQAASAQPTPRPNRGQ